MSEQRVADRRAAIVKLLSEGYNSQKIAQTLGVHRNTVSSDLASMNLGRWTVISDHDLDEVVAKEYNEAHLALGSHALEARLISQGLRIQRKRLRGSRVGLGVIGIPPKRIKRLPWYEARGPDGKKDST